MSKGRRGSVLLALGFLFLIGSAVFGSYAVVYAGPPVKAAGDVDCAVDPCVEDNEVASLSWGKVTGAPTFGNGDITSITVGMGLDGGASSGEAVLSIARAYRLPQSCLSGQIAVWNVTTQEWDCATATDDDSVVGTVDGSEITGGTITADDLASGSVGTEEIADNVVTNSDLFFDVFSVVVQPSGVGFGIKSHNLPSGISGTFFAGDSTSTFDGSVRFSGTSLSFLSCTFQLTTQSGHTTDTSAHIVELQRDPDFAYLDFDWTGTPTRIHILGLCPNGI